MKSLLCNLLFCILAAPVAQASSLCFKVQEQGVPEFVKKQMCFDSLETIQKPFAMDVLIKSDFANGTFALTRVAELEDGYIVKTSGLSLYEMDESGEGATESTITLTLRTDAKGRFVSILSVSAQFVHYVDPMHRMHRQSYQGEYVAVEKPGDFYCTSALENLTIVRQGPQVYIVLNKPIRTDYGMISKGSYDAQSRISSSGELFVSADVSSMIGGEVGCDSLYDQKLNVILGAKLNSSTILVDASIHGSNGYIEIFRTPMVCTQIK